MFDIFGIGVVVALAGLFGWLAVRAWRAKRAWIKWPGVALAGLLTVLVVVVFGAAMTAYARWRFPGDHPMAAIKVAGTPEQIARGEKLARVCAACHSPTSGPEFAGGQDFLAEAGFSFAGTLYSANLTPSHLGEWSDSEIIRAIREGVGKDGRVLLVMPSRFFHGLSDDDAQSIVAYLRSLPPTADDLPPTNLNVLGYLLLNVFPVEAAPPITREVPTPPRGTSDYGHYLSAIMLCQDCHGEELAGLPPDTQGPPPGPNLTKVVPQWTEQQFLTFFRTGQLPSGGTVGALMPWQEVNVALSDDELRDLYTYLHGLSPVEGP